MGRALVDGGVARLLAFLSGVVRAQVPFNHDMDVHGHVQGPVRVDVDGAWGIEHGGEAEEGETARISTYI